MNDNLTDNPMITSAKKAMTPEQIEEYKKIGEYMYSNEFLRTIETSQPQKELGDSEIIFYAVEALKSGLDPHDLSQKELQSLVDIYGDKWYEKFDFKESQVPKLKIQLIKGLKEKVEKMSRQQKRVLKRQEDKLKTKREKQNRMEKYKREEE